MSGRPVLSVRDLVVRHPDRRARRSIMGRWWAGAGGVEAVAGVSFEVGAGEVLGLVGESGCGKSSLARAVVRVGPATSGSISIDGEDLRAAPPDRLRALRSQIQMVFQDPGSSLDPRRTVASSVAEPMRAQARVGGRRGRRLGGRSAAERRDRVDQLLDAVGLDRSVAEARPHQLSGGMGQRVAIARALATSPRLVVLDEPVSALDVSIQADILELLGRLRTDRGVAFLLISHDLSVVRHLADRVAVMYLGRLVEIGPTAAVLGRPSHPYTRALLASAPGIVPSVERARRAARQAAAVGGARPGAADVVPDPSAPPSGCRYRTRCPHAVAICAEAVPELVERGQGHPVACHRADELDVAGRTA